MRISIIGHTSTGKTTLAKRLSEALDIPHLHIDRLWFEAGGKDLPKGESPQKDTVRTYIQEGVLPFIAQEAWVSDGFYPRVQQDIADRADVVLFLDIPLWKRLLNHWERILPGDQRHPELSRMDEWRYFLEIVKRHVRTTPKLEAFARKNASKLKRLHSRKEMDAYVEEVIHRGAVL